jgi:hypothetical protein
MARATRPDIRLQLCLLLTSRAHVACDPGGARLRLPSSGERRGQWFGLGLGLGLTRTMGVPSALRVALAYG